MNRDLYKSFAECLRLSSFKIMMAIKAAYFPLLIAFLGDFTDAFQSTRTDVEGTDLPKCYCFQAPGFEERGPSGERMVCQVDVFMQGHIDSTAAFGDVVEVKLKSAGLGRSMWDRKVWFYHVGGRVAADASLDDILEDFSKLPSDPPLINGKPQGWAMIGLHVDDVVALCTSKQLRAHLEQHLRSGYKFTTTDWTRYLSFDIALNAERRTVSLSAETHILDLADKLLEGTVRLTPKHIMSSTFKDILPGVMPSTTDPEFDNFVLMQELTRMALGTLIWISNVCIQAAFPVNTLCQHMANPSAGHLKAVRHICMHLLHQPIVGEVQLGRQTFAHGGPMSRLGFQNNHSPPTKRFQQVQPRRRPRAPHGHATKCSFLEAANSCIPTCTSAHHDV